MFQKFLPKLIFTALAVLFFSAVVSANSTASWPASTSHVQQFAALNSQAVVVAAASFYQFPATAADKDKKKKAVTPEPATWYYVAGAILLILILERKALKTLFTSAS
jgi:hypothetical protein